MTTATGLLLPVDAEPSLEHTPQSLIFWKAANPNKLDLMIHHIIDAHRQY